MDFRVTIGFQGDVAVIRLRGELDVHTTPTLRAAVDGALDAEVGAVVLDLGDLTFVDSHGIGVIVGCYRAATSSGTALTIRDPSPAVEQILAITAIDRLLTVDRGTPATPDYSTN